jgi:hypothetical protein
MPLRQLLQQGVLRACGLRGGFGFFLHGVLLVDGNKRPPPPLRAIGAREGGASRASVGEAAADGADGSDLPGGGEGGVLAQAAIRAA